MVDLLWPLWRVRSLYWEYRCKNGKHKFDLGQAEILGEPAYEPGKIVTHYKVPCVHCGFSRSYKSTVYGFTKIA